MRHTPSTDGTFWKKERSNSGKFPETLSERFLEFPLRVLRADFREGDEDSNFSVFRVRRFTGWPKPLH